jgi:hypothetical protein
MFCFLWRKVVSPFLGQIAYKWGAIILIVRQAREMGDSRNPWEKMRKRASSARGVRTSGY